VCLHPPRAGAPARHDLAGVRSQRRLESENRRPERKDWSTESAEEPKPVGHLPSYSPSLPSGLDANMRTWAQFIVVLLLSAPAYAGSMRVKPLMPEATARIAPRPVYPYSLVAGGVFNRQELKEALWRDPAIRGQYTGFDIDRLRITQLPFGGRFYVSYRIDNQVYWTQSTVAISQYEPLLTDGVHYLRVRCGNVISLVAHPRETQAVPIALHEMEVPKTPVWPILLLESPPEVAMPPREVAHEVPPVLGTRPPFPLAPLPIVVYFGGGPPRAHKPASPKPIKPIRPKPIEPKPVVTPEPAAWILLGTALAMILGHQRQRRRPPVF